MDDNIGAVGATMFRSCVGWMSCRSRCPWATFGRSCVNCGAGLTTQERSLGRVVAALSPSCPLRVVQHVWKCDDVLNTQRSSGDPDIWGHRQSNQRVNDLNTGCTFFANGNPAGRICCIAPLLKVQLGKWKSIAVHYCNKKDL